MEPGGERGDRGEGRLLERGGGVRGEAAAGTEGAGVEVPGRGTVAAQLGGHLGPSHTLGVKVLGKIKNYVSFNLESTRRNPIMDGLGG